MAAEGRAATYEASLPKPGEACERRCVAEFERAYRLIFVAGMAVGFVIVGVGLLVGPLPGVSPEASVGGWAVAGGAAVFATMIILGQSRYIPAQEMLLWMVDRTADLFEGIDGRRDVPANHEEMLARVADREGPAAMFERIGALAGLGRSAEARVALAGWVPVDPVWACRRERLAARVDRGSAEAHLLGAEAALGSIADPDERAAQRAMLTLEIARFRRRELWPGLGALTTARRQVRSFALSSRPLTKQPAARFAFVSVYVSASVASAGLLVGDPSPATAALLMVALGSPFGLRWAGRLGKVLNH